MNNKRGYFGIGVYHPKTDVNIGTLWRSSLNFDADFIFTIGHRYKKQASDTTKSFKHIPLWQFENWEEFKKNAPYDCPMIFVEQVDNATNIKNFVHPERALYILGAEDYGVPEKIMKGHQKIFIDTPMCLNVSVAGSIIMFDRNNKNHE